MTSLIPAGLSEPQSSASTLSGCPSATLTLASPPKLPLGFEVLINHQVNLELYTSYVSLLVSFYFNKDNVALKDFAKYFLHHEEREHLRN